MTETHVIGFHQGDLFQVYKMIRFREFDPMTLTEYKPRFILISTCKDIDWAIVVKFTSYILKWRELYLHFFIGYSFQ